MKKDVLVYAVQSDEAIMMQVANVMADRELRSKYTEGVDFKQVCFYHDEYTFEVRPEVAESIKEILERCIAQAGEHFNLTIKQIGEGAVGLNWAEVH